MNRKRDNAIPSAVACDRSGRAVVSASVILGLALSFCLWNGRAAGAHQTFVVTNADDGGSGSLRTAMGLANISGGADTITFDPTFFNTPRTIHLTSSLPPIGDDLVIIGPGANLLTVSGDNHSRVLVINSGVTVSLSRMTIFGGNAGADAGGGILNGGELTIASCHITGNTAAFGGGISNELTGSLELQHSTVSNNTATGSFTGGGISSQTNVGIANSTISGNAGTGSNGGNGGGLRLVSGTIENSTITNNWAVGSGSAGGLQVSGGPVTLRNSIVAGNVSNSIVPDVSASSGTLWSGGYNLIGNPGTVSFSGPHDQEGTPAAPLNPLLAPLADNGGETPTRALLAASPALDQGSSFGAITDQRGVMRPFNIVSIAGPGDQSDIGAFEAQAVVVTNADDSGSGSLRQVIGDAPVNSYIFFDQTFFNVPRTIALDSEILINKNLTISGPGADLLNVSGRSLNRVFRVAAGRLHVAISGATFSDGRGSDVGGAIVSNSDLTLSRCAIVDSRAGGSGGAVYVGGSIATFTGCTFSGNSADQRGGAIELESSSASFTNCTISGNTAGGFGGGGGISVFNTAADQTLVVTNNTIVNNTGADTGGIRLESSEGLTVNLALRNSIIANNTGPNLSNSADVGSSVTITSLGYNLTSDDGGGFLDQATDQINKDPRLGPLRNNGGPTQTHALLPGSPAIDQGSSSGSSTDQRGFPRPLDDPAIQNAMGGDGTDIGAFELSLPVCVGDCDTGGAVTVDELVRGVNITLGNASIDDCPSFDTDSSHTVTVDELAQGVNAALNGCQ